MTLDLKTDLMDRARAIKRFEEKLAEEVDLKNFDEFAQAVIFSKEAYLLGYMEAKRIPLTYFEKSLKLINKTIDALPLELKTKGNEIEYYKTLKRIINNSTDY